MRFGPFIALNASVWAGLLAVSPAWAGGLSTTFVQVVAPDIPLGEPTPIHDRAGRNVYVKNLGDEPVLVHVDIRFPQKHRLLDGAEPIPDTSWLKADPPEQRIEGNGTANFYLTLTVPRDKKYAGKYYQVAVRIRSAPIDSRGVMIGSGLLTRLRFRTRR